MHNIRTCTACGQSILHHCEHSIYESFYLTLRKFTIIEEILCNYIYCCLVISVHILYIVHLFSLTIFVFKVIAIIYDLCIVELAQLNIFIYNEDNSSIFLNNPIIITGDGVIVVTIYIVNITENKIWKTRMSLSLPSGAVIDVTESTVLSKYIINDLQIFSHLLGTYDITEATLYNDLNNIGRICYSCHFIRGAIVKGYLISLTSSTYSTNISLMCSPVCSSTVIECTYDIPTGIYNMYVYDIEKEDTLSDDWAISIYHVLFPCSISMAIAFVTITIITTNDSKFYVF